MAGIATEYCVMATALVAVKSGFTVYAVTDAIAPVNVNQGDDEKALQKMREAGIKLVTADDVPAN